MIQLSRLFKTGISSYSHNIFTSPPTFPNISNKIVIRNLTPNFKSSSFNFSTDTHKANDFIKKQGVDSSESKQKRKFKERLKQASSKKSFWAGIISTIFGGEALYFLVKKVPSQEEEEEQEQDNAIYHEPEFGYKGDNEYTNTDPRLWKDSSPSDSNSEYKESSYFSKSAPQVARTGYSHFFTPISSSDDDEEEEVDNYSRAASTTSTNRSTGYLAEEVSDSEEELTKKPRKPRESTYVSELHASRDDDIEAPTITPSTSESSNSPVVDKKIAKENSHEDEEQGDKHDTPAYRKPVEKGSYCDEAEGMKAEYAEEVIDEVDSYGNPQIKLKSNYITSSAQQVQSPIVTSKEIRSTLATIEARDWTRDFFEILEIKDVSQRSQKLRDFTNDFVSVAKDVAKVIVLESNKEDWQKSIPTINKGVAGGQKFISKNIFFKFATDIFGIYGGDEFAAKSAAMELRGLNGIINCNVEGIFFPMMCTIDYLGKRVIASSLLPISDETLIYGSEDAGTTVHADDLEFNDKMRRVAGILNLKSHYIKHHTHLKLHLAADVEGHKGKDGRYYCLDTARVFPPEPPTRSIKSSYLYRLLRPELVRKSPLPLSSDAFSGFGVVDKEEHNQEVKEAFDYMIVTLIPQFAAQLVQNEKEGKLLSIDEILEELHRRGVNWRFIDIFAREIVHIFKDSRYCKILLAEMISRVCKSVMRSIWRESIHEGLESTADCLNLFFGDSPKSSGFWGNQEVELRGKIILPLWTMLEMKYPRIAEIEYPQLQEHLRDVVEHELLFELLLKMTGIRLQPSELKFGLHHSNPYPFSHNDVLGIEPKVKQLNLVSYLETFSLLEQAKLSKDSKEKDALFQMAISRIEESVRSTPGDSFTLIQFGNILAEWARQKEDLNDKQALYKRAFQQFEIASSEHNLGAIPDPSIRNSVILEAKKLRPLLEVYTNWGIALMELASDLENSSLSMAVDLLTQSCDKFEFALKKSRVDEPKILYNSAVALSRLLNLRLRMKEDVKNLTNLFEKANDRFRKASKLYKEMASLQRPNLLSDWSQLLFQYGMKLEAQSLESREMILSAIRKLEKSENLLRTHCDPDTLIETLQRLGFICLQVAQRVEDRSRDILLQAKTTLQRALGLSSESDIRRKDLMCNLGFVHMIEAAAQTDHSNKHNCIQEARSIFQQLWEHGDLRGSYNMASLFARESDESNCRHWMEAHVRKFGLSKELAKQLGDDKDFDSLRNCSWFRELLQSNQ